MAYYCSAKGRESWGDNAQHRTMSAITGNSRADYYVSIWATAVCGQKGMVSVHGVVRSCEYGRVLSTQGLYQFLRSCNRYSHAGMQSLHAGTGIQLPSKGSKWLEKCSTPIENRGLGIDLQPFCTSWQWKNLKKTKVGLTDCNYWPQYSPNGGV